MREGDLAEVSVVGIASIFLPEHDAEQSEETQELLATVLCSPAQAMADAVANNRRLLGLDAP